MKWLARGKQSKSLYFQNEEEWPEVTVVMSVYNEEQVMEKKMECLLALDYPKEKLHLYIGSDCSSDQTNAIISRFAEQDARIHFFPFTQRRGKPGVINELVHRMKDHRPPASNHIYLLTDANVILAENTLRQLVRHYKDPEVMLVDANMISTGTRAEGISKSEDRYVSSEVQLKHREGLVWGRMIGPFGGCYSLRSTHYHDVPPRFLVDDFYITLKAFEQGGKAINDLEAFCYEGVSHDIWEEYRRKKRISAGNFQNLHTFRHLLKLPFDSLGFAFFSHKVLRWLGPFFIIGALVSSLILFLQSNIIYSILLLLQLVILLLIPLFDTILKKMNIHLQLFRNITYFNMMNVALLEGFFKYIKGIKNNVWEPPKRN
ncbi:MAG: glycosyltransferase [Bacteroidota bacterium]